MTNDFLMALLINSAVFTVLFGLMLLIRSLAAKRISAVMQYVLWAVVVIKLVIPFGFESSISPFGLLSAADSSDPIAAQAFYDVDTQQPDKRYIGAGINEGNSSYNQNSFGVNTAESSDTVQDVGKDDSVSASIDETRAAEPVNWTVWAVLVWAVGMLVVIAVQLASLINLRRRVKHASLPVSEDVIRILESCRRGLKMRRHIDVVVQSSFNLPFVMGVLKPTLVLPGDIESKSDEQIRHICLHELTHLKYGDLLAVTLLNALSAVYWFNPFVWICFRFIRKDMETACDARVISHVGTEARQKYIGTVLQFTEHQEKQRLYAAMGMADGRQNMERRIHGMFRKQKTSVKGRIAAMSVAVLILAVSVLTACQPTPEEQIIVGKDQDEMLQAAVQTPNVIESSEPAFTIANMDVPEMYEYSTTGADGKLTVSVNAPVTLPDADILPTAKVGPGGFTQEMVSGMLYYLYGDTPYYQQDNRRTKDELEQIILDRQRQIAEDSFEDHPELLEFQQQQIEEFQKQMETAPDIRDEPKRSDGTMIEDSETGAQSIDVDSYDEDTGYRIASFRCYSTNDTAQPTSIFERINESNLSYSNYSSEDDEYYNYTMDGAQQVYGDEDIPNDLSEKLGITLADAKGLVQGLLDAAGIDYMACSASFVIDDHGTGHVDDYTGVASDFAFKLFYTRSLNGVSVLPTSQFAQNGREEYDYTWIYESLQVIVTDGGIVDINWHSPCDVSEMVTENTNIIDFEQASKIFEQKIRTFYEARVDAYGYDSIGIDINSVQLGLVRIKEQNADGKKAGLYVPVWAFYGTVEMTRTELDGYTYVGYDHGCDFPDKPYVVLAVNAINGSIIDMGAGY